MKLANSQTLALVLGQSFGLEPDRERNVIALCVYASWDGQLDANFRQDVAREGCLAMTGIELTGDFVASVGEESTGP